MGRKQHQRTKWRKERTHCPLMMKLAWTISKRFVYELNRFKICSNIFKSKQRHLPISTKVCDDVSERFRPSIGSLPEEVKWQFQTIQKNPKIHVRASRWPGRHNWNIIFEHNLLTIIVFEPVIQFWIKRTLTIYTFSTDLSQMYKYLMIALWHPQWTL